MAHGIMRIKAWVGKDLYGGNNVVFIMMLVCIGNGEC